MTTKTKPVKQTMYAVWQAASVKCTDVEVVDNGSVDAGGTDEQLTSNTEHGSDVVLTGEVLHRRTQGDQLYRFSQYHARILSTCLT